MGLFTSILGAVAGPIAGLFKKKEKPVENRINYKQMVKDAEAAGFNPLTVLRNGASAGYTSQVQHPALSSSFGDVIASGLNAFATYDPMTDKRADLEYQVVQEQLKQLQQKTRQERKSFDVPTYTGTSTRASGGGFSASSPSVSSNPGGVTNPWEGSILGPYMTVNSGIQDAEKSETRYSDIISNVFGVGVLGADLYASAMRAAENSPSIQKALTEAKEQHDRTLPLRDRGSNAFAKANMPGRVAKPFYPDMEDLRRGQGPAW